MNRIMNMIVVCSLIGLTGTGCSSLGRSDQEAMGQGIVQGTLGAYPETHTATTPEGAISVSGQVLELEGGAYVIEQNDGSQQRLAHDQNTKIDRPAHVGDYIRVWLDERGRAVLIRNIDHE